MRIQRPLKDSSRPEKVCQRFPVRAESCRSLSRISSSFSRLDFRQSARVLAVFGGTPPLELFPARLAKGSFSRQIPVKEAETGSLWTASRTTQSSTLGPTRGPPASGQITRALSATCRSARTARWFQRRFGRRFYPQFPSEFSTRHFADTVFDCGEVQPNPNIARWPCQSSGMLVWRMSRRAVSSTGCRPSAIALRMSGASQLMRTRRSRCRLPYWMTAG